MDYKKCASEILQAVGGRTNLVSAAHCATRLRLVTVDNSNVNVKELENIDGVKGVFESNGQLQIIIGTGTVNKVYDEFLAVSGMSAATKDDVKAAAAAKQPIIKRLIKTLGDVFVPILPAIVASGLMMGLVEALGKIPGLGFAGTDWYQFLDMVANAAFAYLPVIIAVSAARVFGGNIFLGAVMGLLMIHSNLTNGWAAADGYKVWYLFGHWGKIGKYTFGQVNQLGYQGHVIPVVIAVWLMCQIEKKLHKIVPEMLDLFLVPLITTLSTALITFMFIGPVFSTAETYLLRGVQEIVKIPFGIGAFVIGLIYPITVVMGLHHMYNVIEAGMLASKDFHNLNIWMPIASAANFAQFGACLAVGVKTISAKRRTVAVPSAASASLGITEPAIFGVNLRLMKPFICAMVGGACGAAFGSIAGLGAKAYGVTGIPGYLTINNIPLYTIELLIAGGVAFVATILFWNEDKSELSAEEGNTTSSNQPAPVACDDVAEAVIEAPVTGEAVARENIPDQTFASGVMGDGVGIVPTEGVLVAPCDGTVISVQDTKHAVAMVGPKNTEILMHIGVDTVQMNGDGFEALVADGAQVKKGQELIRFNIDKIKAAGFNTTVAVLVTNSDQYSNFEVKNLGSVVKGTEVVVAK